MLKKAKFLPHATVLACALLVLPAQANPIAPPVNPWLAGVPVAAVPAPAWGGFPAMSPAYVQMNPVPFMPMWSGATSAPAATKPYMMRPAIPQQAKKQMMQSMLPLMTGMMRMTMPDAMNWFSHKYQAKPGLSFDDVRDSLFLRANQVNLKKVGENLMWKDFQAVLGDKEAPRIEVYSFCDIAVGRDLLKISPEFVVFLPCRIAIMEDGDKNIWLLMVDWSLDWVAGFENSLGLTPELIQGARSVRERMDNAMQAAANGDL